MRWLGTKVKAGSRRLGRFTLRGLRLGGAAYYGKVAGDDRYVRSTERRNVGSQKACGIKRRKRGELASRTCPKRWRNCKTVRGLGAWHEQGLCGGPDSD